MQIDEILDIYLKEFKINKKYDNIIPFLEDYSSCYYAYATNKNKESIVLVEDGKIEIIHSEISKFWQTIIAFYDEQVYFLDEDGFLSYDYVKEGKVGEKYNADIKYWKEQKNVAGQENIPNRLRYNAQIEDDLTGLYYLRARYYNTGIGRFIQEDVIYNDGLNLYVYCSSNPVIYADPSGYACEPKEWAENSKSGSNAIEIGKTDLDNLRTKLNVPETDTIAVGKTDIPGFENVIFEGESPKVRNEAGLQDIDIIWPNRNIKAPGNNPLFTRHAEEVVANNFDMKITNAGLNPKDVSGTLKIHQSNPTGVCRKCIQGLANDNVSPGVLKQLSLKYPNLTIQVSSESVPGVRVTGRSNFVIRNGKYVE